MKRRILSLILILFMSTAAMANQEKVIEETTLVKPNMELLIDHSYYNGIKIKGIRIKEIELKNNTIIKDGEIHQGEYNSFYVLIELTDMKGNKIEVTGARPLSIGDCEFTVKHDK